jgi:hypothetical protein
MDEKVSKSSSSGVRFSDSDSDQAKTRPRISERPLSSLSTSSATIEERRRSIASLRRKTKSHRKPRSGDRLFAAYQNLPLAVKALVIILVTATPLAVFTGLAYTKYHGRFVGDGHLKVTYENLAVWLDVAWISFLVVVSAAEMLARFFSWLCHTSTVTVKYAPLANTMWFRLTLIAWVGVLHESTCHIWPVSRERGYANNWTWTLRRVFEFMVVAFAILLVQGIVLHLIGIQYVQGYVGPRSERAMDEMETLERLNELLKPYRRRDQSWILMRLIRKMFSSPKRDIFQHIRTGRSTDEEIAGYASILWTSVAGSKTEITQADICERLVELGRDPEGGRELFILLDESGDNKVSRHEFEDLVVLAATQLKKRAGAMRGITYLLRKLEFILCILVFALIMFVYSEYVPCNCGSRADKGSHLLQSRCGEEHRIALDRYHSIVIRLLRSSCRACQLMCLGLCEAHV